MLRTVNFTLIALVLVFLAGCTEPATNSNNSAAAVPTPRNLVPPSRAELVELEKGAIEARKNKDEKFFDGLLARSFVSTGPQGRRDRAAEMASVASTDCAISSYSFSEEALTVLGSDAAALTLKAEVDGECGGQKIPTPYWSATVFVRQDEKWRAAYHGEVPAAEAAARPGGTASTSSPAASDDSSLDQATRALLSIENHTWQARQKKDERILAAVTMLDLFYLDPAGTGRHRRQGTVETWLGANCRLNNYSLAEPKGELLEPNLGLLTYRANAAGNCFGQPLSPVWGATVFMKEMGFWKAILIVHAPAAK